MGRLWRTGWLLMLLPPLFWSGNFVLARGIRADVPPIALSFWRWVGAFIVCLPFAWPYLARDLPVLRRHWGNILLLSASGITAFNTMVYIGLHGTTALNAVLLQSAMPLFILMWAVALFNEWPGPRETAGILVSMAGVAVIAGNGSIEALASLRFNPGDLWVVGAVFLYGLYSALLRKRPEVHPMSFLAATFALGSLMLVPLYALELSEGKHIVWGAPSVLGMLYVAIFPSFVAYLAFNRGVDLIGAGRAGQFIHLMQVFGTVLAVLFLGERLHLYHAGGIGLIACGLWLANRRAAA